MLKSDKSTTRLIYNLQNRFCECNNFCLCSDAALSFITSVDTAAGETSSASGSGAEQSADHGMLHFSLRYDADASTLVVTVVKATGLQDGDAESINPYVKVRLQLDKHQKAKTKVVRRSANPVFEETFTFVGVDAESLQKTGAALHLSVFNSDAFSKDLLIAELLFPLHDVDLQSQNGINIARPLGLGTSKVRTLLAEMFANNQVSK